MSNVHDEFSIQILVKPEWLNLLWAPLMTKLTTLSNIVCAFPYFSQLSEEGDPKSEKNLSKIFWKGSKKWRKKYLCKVFWSEKIASPNILWFFWHDGNFVWHQFPSQCSGQLSWRGGSKTHAYTPQSAQSSSGSDWKKTFFRDENIP